MIIDVDTFFQIERLENYKLICELCSFGKKLIMLELIQVIDYSTKSNFTNKAIEVYH